MSVRQPGVLPPMPAPAPPAAAIYPRTQEASVPLLSICTPSPTSQGPSGPLGSQPLWLMAANISWALAGRGLHAGCGPPLTHPSQSPQADTSEAEAQGQGHMRMGPPSWGLDLRKLT